MLSSLGGRSNARQALLDAHEHDKKQAQRTAASVVKAVDTEITALHATSGPTNRRDLVRPQPMLERDEYWTAVEYIWAISPPYLSGTAYYNIVPNLNKWRETSVFDVQRVRGVINDHPALEGWLDLHKAHLEIKAKHAAEEAEQRRLSKAGILASKIACVPCIAPLPKREAIARARVLSTHHEICSFCQATRNIIELNSSKLMEFRKRYPLKAQRLDVKSPQQQQAVSGSGPSALLPSSIVTQGAKPKTTPPSASKLKKKLPARPMTITWAPGSDLRPPRSSDNEARR